MKYTINNNELIILLDSKLYSLDILYKCFYWYGKEYIVEINRYSENESEIKLTLKSGSNLKEDVEKLMAKIKQDLIDFKLRDIVNKETKSIRELLIAKAFAYYDLHEKPNTDIADPIGFDPTK